MLKPKTIYRAEDFIFKNGTSKPKFFVVLLADKDSVLLLSLTTSKSKLPSKYEIEEGCVQFDNTDGYGHCYVWRNNQILCQNGFSFRLKTYLQLEFRSDLIEISEIDLKEKHISSKIMVCGELIEQEYFNLLKCISKSKFIKNKYLRTIHSILHAN